MPLTKGLVVLVGLEIAVWADMSFFRCPVGLGGGEFRGRGGRQMHFVDRRRENEGQGSLCVGCMKKDCPLAMPVVLVCDVTAGASADARGRAEDVEWH